MDASQDLPASLKDFVKAAPWTYAKTMPRWPHEYIVRKRVDETLFLQLLLHIRQHGYEGTFYQRSITYYDHDGMVYWTMGGPIEEEGVINRCPKENTYETRLRNGTLPEQLEAHDRRWSARRFRGWGADADELRSLGHGAAAFASPHPHQAKAGRADKI